MRYFNLICILTLALSPLAVFANDDQDLGPAIYLNSPPSDQADSQWDDDQSRAANSDNPIVITNNPAPPVTRSRVYGPTRQSDHIWGLADKLRPDLSITVQQMIIALQHTNPNAFGQGNINSLKHGVMLRIPSLSVITEISADVAKAMVLAQNQQWQQKNSAGLSPSNKPINNSKQPVIVAKTIRSIVKVSPPQVSKTNPVLVAKAASVTSPVLGKNNPAVAKAALLTPLVVNKNNPVMAKAVSLTPSIVNKNNPAIVKVQTPTLPAASANNSLQKSKPIIAINKNLLPAVKTLPPQPELTALNKSNPAATKNTIMEEINPPKPILQNNTPINNPEIDVKSMQQQLAIVQQDFQASRNQMNNRLQELQQQNAIMATQLSELNKTLTNLKEQMKSARNNVNANIAQPDDISSSSGSIISFMPRSKVAWWILWGAIFLIVLLWIPSPKRKENATAQERQEPVLNVEQDLDLKDIKDEYDFMNSQEAIPAKLDLARAYMDMEDYISAENVLKEVAKKGDVLERKQAKQILRGIKV